MPGRSRRTLCCLAAAWLLVVGGWRTPAAPLEAAVPVVHTAVVRVVSSVVDPARSDPSVRIRSAVIEPVVGQRGDFDRLAAVAAGLVAVALALMAVGIVPFGSPRRRRPGTGAARTRAPPPSFVS
jgi:hypothetical protein